MPYLQRYSLNRLNSITIGFVKALNLAKKQNHNLLVL